MENPRVLSGEELVAKGVTRTDAALPELGLKDVIPNGSWLEQKQIQAALEARKYLIEVERIEKSGTLSHAVWRDDLMLAEVIQVSGGHWQYLGHNVGNKLYLQPEETLFLMEVNCLLLKHNEVTVSLQKAYALILRSPTTLVQYKVYASLSRIGYKVLRHKVPIGKSNPQKLSESENTPSLPTDKKLECVDSEIDSTDNNSENVHTPLITVNNSEIVDSPLVSPVNISENVDFSKISTGNDSESVEKAMVSSVNESPDMDSPKGLVGPPFENVGPPIVETESTVNESESMEKRVVSSVNEPPNMDSPKGGQTNQFGNVGPPIDETERTGNESDNVEQRVVNSVKESPNMDSSKDGPTNEFGNVGPPIDETDNKTGNVVSPALIIIKNTDVITQSDQSLIVKESNHQGVDDTETVISKGEDGKGIIAKTDTSNDAVKDDETAVIMEIESIAVNSADDVSQAVTYQDVSSTVTECDENVEEEKECMEICQEAVDSGVVLMEEEDNIANSMTADHAGPVDPDNQNIGEENTTFNKDFTNNNSVPNKSNISLTSHISRQNLVYDYLSKIEKLNKRQHKPSDSKSLQKYFESIPDLYKKQIVTVNVPEQELIPRNIYVNNSSYLLNLHNIKRRSVRAASNESASYTSSDEANETNVRRIRNTSGTEYHHNVNFSPHVGFPRHHHFRPYGFWRPQNNLNYYQFSMFFQRPSFSNMYIQSRVQYLPRPNQVLRSFAYPSNLSQSNPNLCQNNRKRLRTGRTAHLQGIKNLAVRLKQIVMSGNTEMHNLESLHNQLHSYNLRYKSRLRLTDNFDVVNEENILETIELDDDEESKNKKPRLDQDHDDKFDENLYRLRQLALRLRDLEAKDLRTASHRRAFSKALKTFNKSYNADIYLDDDNYQIIDRKCITVKSSSESDCLVEEIPKARKGKKLRNPFNILKRRSERLMSLNNPGTSKDDNALTLKDSKPEPNRTDTEVNEAYSERILSVFDKAWLPNENDFGRAEILPNRFMNVRLADSSKEQYIFDFMKNQFQEYKNWLEAKISFLRHLHETNIVFQNEHARILADTQLSNAGVRPLINSGDSSDMPSVLQKLRIIKNNKEICSETSLAIDFDVYNRDVQNFRKTNPPKPHFRIVCLDKSSSFPSAAEVMALHSKYDDNIAIVFAIVGIDSVSYLQINPIDLPVYVPSSDV